MPFLPHKSTPAEASPLQPVEPAEFSPEERAFLLGIAHEAIESAAEGRRLEIGAPDPHLCQPRGVFTTLYLGGELRGCVGYLSPVQPLYRAVMETAQAAASQDLRFPPVSRHEAHRLRVSLSVLSSLRPAQAEEIEIGKHGLVVGFEGRRGLLLPQVAVEHSWDRVTLLEQTCKKAGLPLDAWRSGATLEVFSAEVFGDPLET